MNYKACFWAVSLNNPVGCHVLSGLKTKSIKEYDCIFHTFLNSSSVLIKSDGKPGQVHH